MKKEVINEHLIHLLEKTTPYQRMVWLKKNFEFWKSLKRKRHNNQRLKLIRQK